MAGAQLWELFFFVFREGRSPLDHMRIEFVILQNHHFLVVDRPDSRQLLFNGSFSQGNSEYEAFAFVLSSRVEQVLVIKLSKLGNVSIIVDRPGGPESDRLELSPGEECVRHAGR